MSDNPHVHGGWESYSAVVPTKRLNKGGQLPAEDVEGRALTKENMEQSNLCRTPSRESRPSGLDRVREVAKGDGKLRFTALLHHVTVDLLRSSYHKLKKGAAPGVDGVHGESMDESWRRDYATCTDGSIAGRTKRDHHEESGSRKPMEGNDHWESRRWRTRSSSRRWGRFSTRFGRRTFWAVRMVSGQGAASMMRWTPCMSGLRARK